MKAILFIFLLLLLLGSTALYLLNQHSPDLGVHEGKLTPCSRKPNCVSSQAEDPSQSIAPFPLLKEKDSMAVLLQIVRQLPHATIVSSTPVYLRVEFASPFFRFIDDAEFFRDDRKDILEVRSSARVGYYDFGVNRRRVEEIRSLYLQNQ